MLGKRLDAETLTMLLETLASFAERRLPSKACLELDAKNEFPEAAVRELFGPELGMHLLLIPEEFGGLGGGVYDIYRVSEAMARIELGVATAFLATFLGADPIAVGATAGQRAKWMQRIGDEGLIVAYAVTEPLAGSDVSAIRTRAARIVEDGRVTAYRISGEKQFISNGGVAALYTVLANTDGGPSFFVVEAGTPGLTPGSHEDKHGIRSSNTTPVVFEDVVVPAENLIGLEEGKGLAHAQSVFGFTRLMVAAFGLGGGEAALDRAIRYARERVQAGSPLAEKPAFTHKLIVPHVVQLEAARAYIVETARRLDAGEPELQTEGAIAKLFATEAGNAAADAAIQAHGGYGYMREYEVEKIRRDLRITTIYEGTSEILQWTIARDRWRAHMQSRGELYRAAATSLEGLHREVPDVGADVAALALRAVEEATERARVGRLTRNSHVLFRLGEMMARAEVAANFCRCAAGAEPSGGYAPSYAPEALHAMARISARNAALDVATEALRWIGGSEAAQPDAGLTELQRALRLNEINAACRGMVADMDAVARAVVAQDCRRAEGSERSVA